MEKMKAADFQKAVKAEIFEKIKAEYPDAIQTGDFTVLIPQTVDGKEAFCEVSCVAKTYVLVNRKRIPFTMEIALDMSADYFEEKEIKEAEAKARAEKKAKKIEQDKAAREKKRAELRAKAAARERRKE